MYNWSGHPTTKVKPPEMTNLEYQYGRDQYMPNWHDVIFFIFNII